MRKQENNSSEAPAQPKEAKSAAENEELKSLKTEDLNTAFHEDKSENKDPRTEDSKDKPNVLSKSTQCDLLSSEK